MLSHSTAQIAGELDYRVRNGNGYFPSALAANNIYMIYMLKNLTDLKN